MTGAGTCQQNQNAGGLFRNQGRAAILPPMNEHSLRKILEGGGGAGGRALRALLWAPGVLYGAAMRFRREAYRRGVFSSVSASVPVVSVGNLVAGGSGKTPLVVFLANELLALGRKPAILLRGYRAEAGLSDEAVLYSERAPGAILAINPDRRAGAADAVSRGADVLLLDDGMQHLQLRRDLDIVLVDATSPWGGGNTIPGGLLREPKSALSAAGAVVVTRSDQAAPAALDSLLSEIRGGVPGVPVFTARHKPVRLTGLAGESVPLDSLRRRAVVALSGIARPEAFQRTLSDLGADVVGSVAGRDHDAFTEETVQGALRLAAPKNAVVVITEKDRARAIFSSGAFAREGSTGILTLGIEQDIDGREAFIRLVASRCHL